MMKSLLPIPMLLCAGWVWAGDAPIMPSWMTPYAGAREQTGTIGTRVWSNYSAKAPVAEIVEYYQGLFEGAGLTFHPVKNAMTTTIRGAPAECSLEIELHGMGAITSVSITCSAWTTGHMQGQAKFDQPVYPKAKAPLPPLAWPDWLVSCDPAESPEIQKGVDRFKLRFLKAEFTTRQDRESIQAFYADLLNAHDYPVWIRSSGLTPPDRVAVVEGLHFLAGNPGPRFAMRVQLTPAAGAIQVELRITAHPN